MSGHAKCHLKDPSDVYRERDLLLTFSPFGGLHFVLFLIVLPHHFVSMQAVELAEAPCAQRPQLSPSKALK